MKTVLRLGERLVKDGGANLQRGIESAGGKLYLTDQRLIFEAHAFNLQSGTTQIELSQIQSTQKTWTKFLNRIPVLPNSLAVFTMDGKEHRFVLFQRDVWAQAIENQKIQCGSTTGSKVLKPTDLNPQNQPPALDETVGWFYEENGQRLGPVYESKIVELIKTNQLDRDSSLWKQGFKEWQKLHTTSLAVHLDNSAPPPLGGAQVNNTIVWVLAFAPLIGELLEGFLAGLFYKNAYLAAAAQHAGKFWYVTVILNIVLALWDQQKLQNAGHNTDKFKMWAWLLVPVYLYQRAQYLKQSLAYFIVWLVCFGINLFY